MKTLKIALALAAIIGLSTFAIGLTLADYTNTPYAYSNTAIAEVNEDWWNQMQQYMQARWKGIEDEDWFDDMNQYIGEHWNEVQNQEWFNAMLEYMQEHGFEPYCYEPYGYGTYGDNSYNSYYGPSNYGRSFGCRRW